MEMLNYIREYAAGFRMPNLSKLWYGKMEGDEVDSGNNEAILIQIEYYLVKVQELALWTDPTSSALALGVVHLFFAYLATTSNTTFNLAIWTVLAGFLYITWTQKIWPEIRVDAAKDAPQIQYTNPEVFTASELQDIIIIISGKSKRLYTYLVEMRRENPGKFCFLMCTSLSIVAYIGSGIRAFCLFYYLTVAGLVVPGCLKYIIRNYPPAQEAFANLRIIEEIKCKNVKKKTKHDVVDGGVSGIVDMRCAADKMQSIVQNVCSTLQTGVTSLASNLPDLHQLEMQQKQLKEGSIEDSLYNQTGGEENDATLSDDLAPYLPDVNSIESSQLLETCVRDFELEYKDPTEADAFENDDNNASMLECSMAGLDHSIMPDHDELDSMPSINPPILHNMEVSLNASIVKPISCSTAAYDDFDESNREFLPAKVSEQPQISNISNDEFDLEDDSRQLSIDQSFPESHQSDNGEDSIPYDNNDLAVRTAMQELIDEEEAAMLPNKHVMTDSEINPTPFRTIDNKPHEEAVSSPSNDLQESTSTKDNSSDDYIEEDFELISADELSLNKNT